jgi:hypothetical protein
MSVDNDAGQGATITPVRDICTAFLADLVGDLPDDQAAHELAADYRHVFFGGAWCLMRIMLDARANGPQIGKAMLDLCRAELDQWDRENHPNDFRPLVRPAKPAPAGTPPHHCHWPGCTVPVPPKMWGCRDHWFKLPKHLRDKIWQAYRPGQEVTKTPSPEYVAAAREVREWVIEHFPDARGE